jgi:hypothetical protein
MYSRPYPQPERSAVAAGEPASGSPLVTIVIVNYNGLAHLRECLESVRAQDYPAFEVILVDNHSTDGSLDLTKREFAEFRVVESQENLGYSGAANLGLAHASGAYVAILNMDVVVEPDWLWPLVDYLEKHPQVGAVAPKIMLYGDRERINALGQNVHVTGLGFNRLLHRPAALADRAPRPVSGLQGAAFLIRKDLLDSIGGMNAANFMYHEDVDISLMVLLAGFDLYCVPASVVYHKYSLFMNPWKLYYLERNRWALLLSTFRWPTMLLLSPLFLLTELMMAVFCLRRGREFIASKGKAVAWNWQQRRRIRQRRAYVQSLRRRPDRQLVRILRLNYDWDQFIHLGKGHRS